MSELASIDINDAKTRLDRVKIGVERIWDDLVALYKGRAWLVLGYRSWEDLCDSEFAGARIALPRNERREVVTQMRSQGMSTRAISRAIGVSTMTVHGDISSTVQNCTVDEVVSLDGKVRPASRAVPNIPPLNPLESFDADELSVITHAVQMSPLTEVINQLDEIAQDAEHFALPRIIGDDHEPVAMSPQQRNQLERTAARLRATADHIETYLRSNP